MPHPYRSVRYIRPHHPTERSGKLRYELDTGTEHFGRFGTPSIPAPDTSVASVLHTSIAVPDTSIRVN